MNKVVVEIDARTAPTGTLRQIGELTLAHPGDTPLEVSLTTSLGPFVMDLINRVDADGLLARLNALYADKPWITVYTPEPRRRRLRLVHANG